MSVVLFFHQFIVVQRFLFMICIRNRANVFYIYTGCIVYHFLMFICIEKSLVLAKLTPRTALSCKSVTSAIFERFSDKCTLFLKRTFGPQKHFAENSSQGYIASSLLLPRLRGKNVALEFSPTKNIFATKDYQMVRGTKIARTSRGKSSLKGQKSL